MAPCEWVIDIIKEWVIAQAYATMAWVEAKVYATEAWVLSLPLATIAYVNLEISDLKNWIIGQHYLKTGSVDRGDPAVYDWDIGDLTIDDAWHDLDLSGIVPAGAKSVLFNLYVRATAVNKSLLLRKNGNLNVINAAGIMPPVANVFYRNDSTVACDTDRKIEYLGNAGFFNAIYIVVRGWWF